MGSLKRPLCLWEKGFPCRVLSGDLFPVGKKLAFDPKILVEDDIVVETVSEEALGSLPRGAPYARISESVPEPKDWISLKDEKRHAEIDRWVPLLLCRPELTDFGRHLSAKRLRSASHESMAL
eukprot:3804503-Amphidinium_carterae.1